MKRGGPLHRRRARRDHDERPLASWCEIAKAGVCLGRAVHRHHVVLQSQGGRGGETLDVCNPCHAYAHLHRVEAREQGWIIDRRTV